VLKYPEHGTIELIPADGPANFPKENKRSKCNGKKVKGINVIYNHRQDTQGQMLLT
jgi:hypothetical protein